MFKFLSKLKPKKQYKKPIKVLYDFETHACGSEFTFYNDNKAKDVWSHVSKRG